MLCMFFHLCKEGINVHGDCESQAFIKKGLVKALRKQCKHSSREMYGWKTQLLKWVHKVVTPPQKCLPSTLNKALFLLLQQGTVFFAMNILTKYAIIWLIHIINCSQTGGPINLAATNYAKTLGLSVEFHIAS